jgi:hypothetical protein
MDMSNPSYPHLLPQIRTLADAPGEIRIQRIRADRWIGYARAEAALAAMDDLLTFPKRTRMPNLLLVGPSNNGKTMIVEKFKRAHLRDRGYLGARLKGPDAAGSGRAAVLCCRAGSAGCTRPQP